MSSSNQLANERLLCATPNGQYELQLIVSLRAADFESVTRVVIVCHGRERDASLILSQAISACPSNSATLLVAPCFYNALDEKEYRRMPGGTGNLLVWKGNNWGEGGASQYPAGSQVSSFQALDTITGRYGSRQQFPKLQSIVVVGHSMGGQLVQRYSILGQPQCEIPISYIVMNASTHFYPINEYNYKYGLRGIEQSLFCYAPALVESQQLYFRIKNQRVHYLQGAADRGIGDDRPEAMKQGVDRRQRLQNWKRYLDSHGLSTLATFDLVPQASHDAGQMMKSSIGVHYIFKSM